MRIEYRAENVYGRELFYPTSEDAHMIAKLTGKKTLLATELDILEAAGHSVERVKT